MYKAKYKRGTRVLVEFDIIGKSSPEIEYGEIDSIIFDEVENEFVYHIIFGFDIDEHTEGLPLVDGDFKIDIKGNREKRLKRLLDE